MKRFALGAFSFLFVVLMGMYTSPIYAASYNFTVDDDGDGGDSNPGDSVCDTGGGVCTLRAAIEEANTLITAVDDVTINFAVGVTQIDIATQLVISTPGQTTLNGAGVTVDNTGLGRVLQTSAGDVTINGLTITGGDGNDGFGAGINVYTASLTLQNGVLVTENDAGTNWGGGIFLELETGAVLVVDNSTISHNNAQYGGGIFIDDGTSATLQNGALVTQNTTNLAGAGIFAFGSLTMTDSAVTYNLGNTQGSGIYYAQYIAVPVIDVNNSCIVCNGDNAVSGPAGISADFSDNWWGSEAGPYYSTDTQGLQCSAGDSVSIDTTLADRNISVATAGICPEGPLATGDWLTTPTAGCTGNEVVEVSSVGRARTCTPPP